MRLERLDYEKMVQQRVYEDIIALFGDSPTIEELAKYFDIPKYLVREELRLRGVEDLVTREVIEFLKIRSFYRHSLSNARIVLRRLSKEVRQDILFTCDMSSSEKWIRSRVFSIKERGLKLYKEKIFEEFCRYRANYDIENDIDRQTVYRIIERYKREYNRKNHS